MINTLLKLTVIILFVSAECFSQDTFSITAIDTVTGEIGSAGASCIAGSIILTDIRNGIGVIHTQASYLAANQNYARQLMILGLSPQQIIDSLIAHDAQNNPHVRQYGITDFRSGVPRTAAYTGANCINYKNHKIGRNYTIHGNILLGQLVLDSMEARFLRTQGTLAQKLMAALQGAKMPGADTRCQSQGTSSKSAFIRVAKTTDPQGSFFLNLNVNNTAFGVEPIDSLQVLFNQWFTTGINTITSEIPSGFSLHQNYPNPFNPVTKIQFDIPLINGGEIVDVSLQVYDASGKLADIIAEGGFRPGTFEAHWNANTFASGVYYYTLRSKYFTQTRKMLLIK